LFVLSVVRSCHHHHHHHHHRHHHHHHYCHHHHHHHYHLHHFCWRAGQSAGHARREEEAHPHTYLKPRCYSGVASPLFRSRRTSPAPAQDRAGCRPCRTSCRHSSCKHSRRSRRSRRSRHSRRSSGRSVHRSRRHSGGSRSAGAGSCR